MWNSQVWIFESSHRSTERSNDRQTAFESVASMCELRCDVLGARYLDVLDDSSRTLRVELKEKSSRNRTLEVETLGVAIDEYDFRRCH